MMPARVMIVVTHLLGSGHLFRALTLGRAFAHAGHAVDLISGGFPVGLADLAGLAFHQLPPLRSDGSDFSRLIDAEGGIAAGAIFAARQQMLTDLLRERAPDILITELFPFGRRNLLTEFEAVLIATHDLPRRPRVFSSIRDILAPPSKPAKQALAESMIARHYDGVLVHSEKTLMPLEASWPVSPTLSRKLAYTGFVAAPLPPRTPGDGDGEVLVSAGGGSVGDPVFRAAVAAAREYGGWWRLLVGGQDAEARIATLRAEAPRNVTIERIRPDFRAMLLRAEASVSLCGYNTAMDLLQTGLPAVIVPFAEGAEVEQTLRAAALARLPGFEAVPMETLTGPILSGALGRVRQAPRRDRAAFRFDGAESSVRICTEFLA